MKTKRRTEVVCILDKSGSMSGLEQDTIGGYNSMLQKQRDAEGEAVITTVLFNGGYELLHDRIDIRAVQPITGKDYCVGGSTALIDAIGKTIHKIATVQKNTAKAYRAQNVLFVIITDGEENSSREFSSAQVKEMIERQKAKYGWEFLFLGANIDAVETAAQFGIAPDRAQQYHCDSTGTALNYETMATTVLSFCKSASLPEDWNRQIQKDYAARAAGTRPIKK